MRVLVTGVANFWGRRLARRLLDDPAVDHVVGLDTRDAPPELAGGSSTFVGVDLRAPDLAAAIREAAPDAVVHNDLAQFPEPGRSASSLHDVTVIGTLNLLAALGTVPGLRTLVVRGSAAIYGSEAGAPAFFPEDLAGRFPLRTRWQRDVGELERLVESFARRRDDVTCCVLRSQPVLGPTLDTPITRLFRSPVVPTHLGFDPRVQVVHEDDSVGALHAAVLRPVAGPVNVAGPGTISLGRMLSTLGRRGVPLAGPLFRPAVDVAARATGVRPMTEDVARWLKHGRGVDTTRLEAVVGFTPRTTLQAVEDVAREAA